MSFVPSDRYMYLTSLLTFYNMGHILLLGCEFFQMCAFRYVSLHDFAWLWLVCKNLKTYFWFFVFTNMQLQPDHRMELRRRNGHNSHAGINQYNWFGLSCRKARGNTDLMCLYKWSNVNQSVEITIIHARILKIFGFMDIIMWIMLGTFIIIIAFVLVWL